MQRIVAQLGAETDLVAKKAAEAEQRKALSRKCIETACFSGAARCREVCQGLRAGGEAFLLLNFEPRLVGAKRRLQRRRARLKSR